MDWGTIFLYLHISGVIVGFGSSIAFPFIAAKAQSDPLNGAFALRVMTFITERVVEPGAIFVFLTGVGLIVARGLNPLTTFWVALAIVLFLITFVFANVVQLRTLRRMVAMTAGPPAGAPDPGSGTGGPPPPEFLALIAKADKGGKFLTVMIFVLLALMVFKPTL